MDEIVKATCVNELTEKGKWDGEWSNGRFPKPIDSKTSFGVSFDRLIKSYFKGCVNSNLSLLEVGCAGGAFMIYFEKNFGFDVMGLDYSKKGCELAKKNLELAGIDAKIICGDFFNKKTVSRLGNFDIVFSGGFIEHFEDTHEVIKKHAELLKDGGLLIIEVPNMIGLQGLLLRKFNPECFREHKTLTIEDINEGMLKCGLIVEKHAYVGSIIMASGGEPKHIQPVFKAINMLFFLLNRFVGLEIKKRDLSPYLVVIGRKQNVRNQR